MMKVVIRVSEQKATLFRDEVPVRTFVVSTARNGVGTEPGSFKTPLGRLKIHKKIGHGAKQGQVFRGRVATSEIWRQDPEGARSTLTEDLVLTRILWLEGCEPENANTRGRYIYLHGTNQEHLIGTASSHGCIRLRNQDIVELFDQVEEGDEVLILA